MACCPTKATALINILMSPWGAALKIVFSRGICYKWKSLRRQTLHSKHLHIGNRETVKFGDVSHNHLNIKMCEYNGFDVIKFELWWCLL